jgi:opacity protein-like surface antigen
MKRIFFFILIISSFLKLKAQEIMVTGGLNMPLAPYSTKDILDSKNGRALNGFNFKIDYVFLKQTKLNFSLNALYFSNQYDIESIKDQYNTVFASKSKFLSIKPYTGIGFGGSVLYYFTPLKNKIKGFSKITLGQLFVNSPEYSKTDSLEYIKFLSLNSSNIFWNLGAGVDIGINSNLSIIAYAEYFFSKVDFGSTKASNAAGQIATLPSSKINEQEFGMLNFNIGLSYKFYSDNFKPVKKVITPLFD